MDEQRKTLPVVRPASAGECDVDECIDRENEDLIRLECTNCRDSKICAMEGGEGNQGQSEKDYSRLITFLAEQCKDYEKLLSDYPESGSPAEDYEIFSENRAELLDNTWNVVYRHFTGEPNGGFLPGPDGINLE